MNKRSIFCASLAVALFLATGTSHARWMNPNTGRFWTMDSYEGNEEEPKSLHRYAYGEGDPVDNVDPSGHEIEGALTVASISGSLFAQISPALAAAAVTAGAAGTSRPLTQGEIAVGQSVFGGKVTCSKVNVFLKKQNPWHPKDTLITPNGKSTPIHAEACIAAITPASPFQRMLSYHWCTRRRFLSMK